MDWIPIFLVAFKLVVFGTGMFFAIKWHFDRAREEREKSREVQAAGARETHP